jgi:hypothetical protein
VTTSVYFNFNAQELTEKIMSGEIDPDAIEALLKDSTR